MTVDVQKIRLGACDVTFKGSDLGSTKGGVEVEVSTETYEVKVDQTGESPVKDIIIGTVVNVTVPMAETDMDRLNEVLPQSVLNAQSGSQPSGWMVNNVSGYSVGDVAFNHNSGSNNPEIGDSFTFAGHTSKYRVTDITGRTVTFVNDDKGNGGLVAPVADDEAVTYVKGGSGVEIRTGVNTDLLAIAGALKLHPTGLPAGNIEQDFNAFLAAPTGNFSFKFELNAERVYEVMFKCYPDTNTNDRIAAFGSMT